MNRSKVVRLISQLKVDRPWPSSDTVEIFKRWKGRVAHEPITINNLVVSECFWLFLIVFAVFGKHMDGMHPLSSTWFEPLRDEYRTHPGNRTERKRSGPSWPKADLGQTWPSLALSWAEQEPTWAQLGPNLRRTLASWPQLRGHLAPKLGQDRPNVGNMALHEPPSKQQKTLEIAVKTQVLRVLRWARKIGPGWAQLRLGQPLKKPNLSPSCAILDNWAQVGANGPGNPLDGPQIEAMWCTWGPSQVQSGGAWNFLATASHQVGQRRHHAWKHMFWRFRIGPAVSQCPRVEHMELNLGWHCSQMCPS